MQKYSKYKKVDEKDQQTIKAFDKIYRKNLQDNISQKNAYECSCNIFTNYLDETNTNLLYKHEQKVKRNFFSNDDLKINPGPIA